MRYVGVLWAARKYYRDHPQQRRQISDTVAELYAACGWRSRMLAPLAGRRLYYLLCREEARLRNGWRYEPPTFYEVNAAAEAAGAVRISAITPPRVRRRKDATEESLAISIALST